MMESMSRPPMPSESEAVTVNTKSNSFFPNGALKKHNQNQNHYEPAPELAGGEEHHVYRECMKNHAASLGGHALDGCGEFMPSPTSDPSIPSSLICAACSCHRNFHRRLSLPRPPSDDSDDEDDSADEVAAAPTTTSPTRRRSPSAFYSAPHMLLALSSGIGATRSGNQISPEPTTAPPRKRFRTKFTAKQKDRMHELSERLGWRMRRHDEGFVEEKCREIGVGKGVFKVWMHNNKHNFLIGASSRRQEIFFPGDGHSVRAAELLHEAHDAADDYSRRQDLGNPANGGSDDHGGASSSA